MDNNLANEVYTHLKDSTTALEELKAQVAELEQKCSSGKYSDSQIAKYKEQQKDLRREIRRDSDAAIAAAQGLVDAYETDARREMELVPTDLTDDIRLLNAGIRLTENDLEAMLRRNAGNLTMQQILIRYAAENGIAIRQHGFPEFAGKLSAAQDMRGIVDYYSKWITEGNAMVMLDKFFNVRA